jgi:predicted nucleotidyltransferase
MHDLQARESSIKSGHDLYQATDGAQFEAALRRRETDIDDLLRGLVSGGQPIGVLLGGSIAEGVANPSSDVDLLVLLEDNAEITPSDGLNLRPGRAVETVTYRAGVEFNIEMFRQRDVLRLIESFVQMAPALYDPHELDAIPMLQPYDLRFLHRLRTGWILRGPEVVDRWRDELMVDLLPIYLTVRHLNAFNELFEDALAFREIHPPASFLTSRTCIEHCLQALLACRGFTSQAKKWIPYWIDRLPVKEDSQLARAGLGMLLRGFDESELPAHLSAVRALGRDIAELLAHEPEIGAAMTYLRHNLTYLGD